MRWLTSVDTYYQIYIDLADSLAQFASLVYEKIEDTSEKRLLAIQLNSAHHILIQNISDIKHLLFGVDMLYFLDVLRDHLTDMYNRASKLSLKIFSTEGSFILTCSRPHCQDLQCHECYYCNNRYRNINSDYIALRILISTLQEALHHASGWLITKLDISYYYITVILGGTNIMDLAEKWFEPISVPTSLLQHSCIHDTEPNFLQIMPPTPKQMLYLEWLNNQNVQVVLKNVTTLEKFLHFTPCLDATTLENVLQFDYHLAHLLDYKTEIRQLFDPTIAAPLTCIGLILSEYFSRDPPYCKQIMDTCSPDPEYHYRYGHRFETEYRQGLYAEHDLNHQFNDQWADML